MLKKSSMKTRMNGSTLCSTKATQQLRPRGASHVSFSQLNRKNSSNNVQLRFASPNKAFPLFTASAQTKVCAPLRSQRCGSAQYRTLLTSRKNSFADQSACYLLSVSSKSPSKVSLYPAPQLSNNVTRRKLAIGVPPTSKRSIGLSHQNGGKTWTGLATQHDIRMPNSSQMGQYAALRSFFGTKGKNVTMITQKLDFGRLFPSSKFGLGLLFAALIIAGYCSHSEAQAKTPLVPQAPIYKIVMTGGPCGGKSTALSQISTHLEGLGFRVYTVPEAATMFITGGVQVRGLSTEQTVQFQGNLIKAQIALEDSFYDIARATGQPSVIFCDRGAMDSQAYVPKNVWQLILDIYNFNTVQLRDERYDSVIHLVTAAIGAEKFYTTENNNARSETPEEARNLDFRVLNSWVGHRNLKIIDNSTDFSGKIQRVVSSVCETVGVPFPVENQRRLQIGNFQIPSDIRFEEFEIEQTYLTPSQEDREGPIKSETRIRRRGQGERQVYDLSVKKFTPDGKSVLLERLISGREYVNLLSLADPERAPVKKTVRCFSHDNQIFYLNKYHNMDLVILEVNSEDKEVKIPPWLPLKRDVTGNEEFSSYEIAKKKRP